MTIHTPTTLILGAGASCHLDLPLGRDLICKIMTSRVGFNQEYGEFNRSTVNEFRKRLSRSGYDSIDAFLAENIDHSRIGKLALTQVLISLERLERMYPPHPWNWYQYLFLKMIDDSNKTLRGNQLAIVTYNYDRSIEAFIFHSMIARWRLSEEQAADELRHVPIIHVHGSLGAFPRFPYNQNVGLSPNDEDVTECLERSESVKIIHELDDACEGFCSDEFRKAHELIKSAEKVYFMGFGFHEDNVRRLKVDWPDVPEVRSTFQGMNSVTHSRLVDRLAHLGFDGNVLPFTGALTCSNFFGEKFVLE